MGLGLSIGSEEGDGWRIRLYCEYGTRHSVTLRKSAYIVKRKLCVFRQQPVLIPCYRIIREQRFYYRIAVFLFCAHKIEMLPRNH